MLDGAFSFQGRLGRLNYFLGGLVMLPAAIVAGLVLGLAMAGAHRGLASIVFFAACVLVFAIVAIWYSLSLQVRRIRDIGWSPLYVLVGALVLRVVDAGLAMQVPALALGHAQVASQVTSQVAGQVHAHLGTPFGVLLNLALSLALLFWPGRNGSDIAAVFDPPAPRPSRGDALGGGVLAVAAPRTGVVPRGGVRKEFGRRGVK